jgi:hypothetical protein
MRHHQSTKGEMKMGVSIGKNQVLANLQRIYAASKSKVFGGFKSAPSRARLPRTKYSGEQLREIRARKGVGRPPHTHSNRIGARLGYMGYRAYWYAGIVGFSPNYAEWLRKPRRKVRGPAA